MNSFKELLERFPSVKVSEYTALNFSAYITAQIEQSEETLTPMESFYLGYFMGNLPVLVSCKENITDSVIESNETIKAFEKVMNDHNLWGDFEECVIFTEKQLQQ